MKVKIHLEFAVHQALWELKMVQIFENSQLWHIIHFFSWGQKWSNKIPLFFPREKFKVESEH